MSARRTSPQAAIASTRSGRQWRGRRTAWIAVSAVVLVVAGALAWGALRRNPSATGPGGLPGAIGGPEIAQDVNTLVGRPAPLFTLEDSEGRPYAVNPGHGRPTALIFHMGIT